MIKIRITAPCTTAQLSLEPGDELHVGKITPQIETLLNARRIDDEPVARIVKGQSTETATARNRTPETSNA